MEILLARIRETTGKPVRSACGHQIAGVCGGCHTVAYCGTNCQTSHWQAQHKYECIGAGHKREREETEAVINLNQLHDLWSVVQPWLNAEDLKNLRLASPEIERQIRRTYFARFRVRLTARSFAEFRPEIAPFITKVDDSESGGRLAFWLSRNQQNKALKNVKIERTAYINWNSLTLLVNLTHLYLNNNQLTAIPESFGNLVNLTKLSLGSNQLTSLPESFGNLVNLTTLWLGTNQLTSLPESFGNLVNLKILWLDLNRLTAIPESFGNFVNLTKLSLGSNQLTSLPESFGNLVNLTTLWLGTNRLTELPESFGNLVNLTELSLYNNPLTDAAKDWLRGLFGNKVRL